MLARSYTSLWTFAAECSILVHRLISYGLRGSWDRDHSGASRQLSESERQKLRNEIRRSPRELGYNQNLWDGPSLSYHLKEHCAVKISIRQYQVLFHRLGFILQRPSCLVHETDPVKQEDFKKILPMDEKAMYLAVGRKLYHSTKSKGLAKLLNPELRR